MMTVQIGNHLSKFFLFPSSQKLIMFRFGMVRQMTDATTPKVAITLNPVIGTPDAPRFITNYSIQTLAYVT